MAGNGNGQSSRRVIVSKEHICNGITALFSRIVSREQRIGVCVGPVLVQRASLDIDHNEWFSCLFQCLKQFILPSKQVERGTVKSFTTFHIADVLLLGTGSARVLIGSLEIPGRRASHNGNNDISAAGNRCCRCNIAINRVSYGAPFDITAISLTYHGLDTVIDCDDLAIGLWSGIVAQHIIDVVGIGPYDGHLQVLAQRQDTVILKQGDGFLCRMSCCSDGFYIVHQLTGCFLVNVGVLKQSHLKF